MGGEAVLEMHPVETRRGQAGERQAGGQGDGGVVSDQDRVAVLPIEIPEIVGGGVGGGVMLR